MESKEIESALREIRIELERAKEQTFEAIRNYPTPITACDQQFDRLLEQRESISSELQRMCEIENVCQSHPDATRLIDEFLRGSTCLGAAHERIASGLRQTRPTGEAVDG